MFTIDQQIRLLQMAWDASHLCLHHNAAFSTLLDKARTDESLLKLLKHLIHDDLQVDVPWLHSRDAFENKQSVPVLVRTCSTCKGIVDEF